MERKFKFKLRSHKKVVSHRGPPTENFTKELPVILIWAHFTKKSHGSFFLQGNPFLKFFRILKSEIEFHSHKKSCVSPKLENSAHLFLVNFKFAKFQKN